MKTKLYLLWGETASSGLVDDYQARLEVICRVVNTRYSKHLHTNLTPHQDPRRVGVVLLNVSRVYDILDIILKGLYPQSMRFVLVHGILDGAQEGDISHLEGPAMEKATQMMTNLERDDLLFEMSVDRKETDLALSGLVNSVQLLKQGLSAKKRRIISEYVKTGKQSLAAQNLNMTQQGVSKALKSSNWREIIDGERKLQRALEIYSDRLGRKQRSLDDFY
ncbi:MAG: hypothetical protein ABFC91_03790 [Methanobacteriaceae archaeon]